MGFIKIVRPVCKCDHPPLVSNSYGLGTTWKCDKCKKVFKLSVDTRGERYWQLNLSIYHCEARNIKSQ